MAHKNHFWLMAHKKPFFIFHHFSFFMIHFSLIKNWGPGFQIDKPKFG